MYVSGQDDREASPKDIWARVSRKLLGGEDGPAQPDWPIRLHTGAGGQGRLGGGRGQGGQHADARMHPTAEVSGCKCKYHW